MAGILEVQIMPTTGSLYQRGFGIDTMEVEPGETFNIDKKYQGTVNCEEKEYIFWDRDEFTNWKEQAEAADTYLRLYSVYTNPETALIFPRYLPQKKSPVIFGPPTR